MGTNYFYCYEDSGDYITLHIGKSSIGWQFAFQGYEIPSILSRTDWENFITEHLGKIYDEYSREIRVSDFWDFVNEKQQEHYNHYDYCKEHYCEYVYLTKEDWKDDQGYSFSSMDFS